MPSPFVGGRISQGLHTRLESHIKETGEKLPEILKKALSVYLDYPLAQPTHINNEVDDRFKALEERVAVLEASLKKVANQTTRLMEKPLLPPEIHPDQLSLLETTPEVTTPQLTEGTKSEKETAVSSQETKTHIEEMEEPEPVVELLGEITQEETSRRTGIKTTTLTVYRSQNKEIIKNGFRYRPNKGRGKHTWFAEKLNN
jgi:hypothetical protein